MAPRALSGDVSPESPDITGAKAALRAELVIRRRTLSSPEASSGLLAVMRGAVDLPQGSVVASIWPLEGEPDLRPLCHGLHEDGYRVALPVTPPKGQGLSFRSWTPRAGMLPGRRGTSYPDGVELEPDLIFVPLLGFDARGYRIGYGAGFYDRTLAARPGVRAIGFAFAGQEVQSIPIGPHDVALDAIATENGILRVTRD